MRNYLLKNKNLNEPQYPQLNIGVVSGSLPSDEEIREGADDWVFKINGTNWSNSDNTAMTANVWCLAKEAIISTKLEAEYKCLLNHKCFCGELNRLFCIARVISRFFSALL